MKKFNQLEFRLDRVYEYAFSSVPISKRKPAWRLTPILVGFALSTSGLMTGGRIGRGMPFLHAVGSCLLGNTIIFAIALFWGILGCRTGYTGVHLVKRLLGIKTAALFSIFVIVAVSIWLGINGDWLADVLAVTFPHCSVPIQVNALLIVIIITVGSLHGWRAMETCNMLLVPLIVLLAIGGIRYMGVVSSGFTHLSAQPGIQLSVSAALSLITGSFSVSAVTIPNFCRFAKTGRSVLFCVSAYALTLTASTLCGVLIAQVSRTNTLAYGLYVLGLTRPAFFWLLLCAYTTQNVNMYTGSLAFQGLLKETKMGGNLSHKMAVLLIGGYAMIVASIGGGQFLAGFTRVVAVASMALTIIVIEELFLRRNLGQAEERTPMVAWLVGIAAGSVARYWGVSGIWVIAPATSGFLYLLMRSMAWLNERNDLI